MFCEHEWGERREETYCVFAIAVKYNEVAMLLESVVDLFVALEHGFVYFDIDIFGATRGAMKEELETAEEDMGKVGAGKYVV